MFRHYLLAPIMLCLLVVSCKSKYHLSSIKSTRIEASENNADIQKMIEPYKVKLDSIVTEKISYTQTELPKKGGQSLMGYLMADIAHEVGDSIYFVNTKKHLDFVMFNKGGVRAAINKGPITIQEVFEVMPFENKLVVMELQKKDCDAVIEYIKSKKGEPTSFPLKISNQSVTLNDKIFSQEVCTVLTTDYLQKGGDRMFFFKNPIQLYDLNIKLRDAMIHWFRLHKTINFKPGIRFDYTPENTEK